MNSRVASTRAREPSGLLATARVDRISWGRLSRHDTDVSSFAPALFEADPVTERNTDMKERATGSGR